MLKVQEIRELIRLVDQSSISEFTYETSESTITLKKGVGTVQANTAPEVVEQSAQPQAQAAVEVKEQALVQAEEEPVQETVVTDTASVDYDYEIISPMVGTLYRASSPENDPYVENGSAVTKDSVVCIVEAMKLFNEIEAEVDGNIVEILVEDGELVEYGQPLFRVKKK